MNEIDAVRAFGAGEERFRFLELPGLERPGSATFATAALVALEAARREASSRPEDVWPSGVFVICPRLLDLERAAEWIFESLDAAELDFTSHVGGRVIAARANPERGLERSVRFQLFHSGQISPKRTNFRGRRLPPVVVLGTVRPESTRAAMFRALLASDGAGLAIFGVAAAPPPALFPEGSAGFYGWRVEQ